MIKFLGPHRDVQVFQLSNSLGFSHFFASSLLPPGALTLRESSKGPPGARIDIVSLELTLAVPTWCTAGCTLLSPGLAVRAPGLMRYKGTAECLNLLSAECSLSLEFSTSSFLQELECFEICSRVQVQPGKGHGTNLMFKFQEPPLNLVGWRRGGSETA